ncbi:hypothetical protein BLA29_012195, partial [Euroglyphus maynei]
MINSDEYDPYSYGFRPLSERNIYRSYEIIRTPTTNINNTKEKTLKKSTIPFDEVDNIGQTTKTKVISSEERLPSINNKNLEENSIPTIMVNERPVDVP